MGIHIKVAKNRIYIKSSQELSEVILRELSSLEIHLSEERNLIYSCSFSPYNAYIMNRLQEIAKKGSFTIHDREMIDSYADKVEEPIIYSINEGWALLDFPMIKSYQELLNLLGAKRIKMNTSSVPFSRLYELLRMARTWKHPFLPAPKIDNSLLVYTQQFNSKTISSLFRLPMETLMSVKHGYRVNPNGFKKLKIQTAADILLHRPVRYEDRSHFYKLSHSDKYGGPRLFKVIVVECNTNPDNKSLTLLVEDEDGTRAKCRIWGIYLKSRLIPDTTVIVSGTLRGKEIYGATVISELETKAMPIKPVYPQSPSNYIKTNLLINCVQELIERCDLADLGPYLKESSRDILGYELNFEELINQLHFPDSKDSYLKSIEGLAYIEMVFMQLIFKEELANDISQGYSREDISKSLSVRAAIESLPFEMTDSQKRAIKEISGFLEKDKPTKNLISGDVGSGKTLVAQMLALYNYDNKLQTAIACPTEVLAQQIFKSTQELVSKVNKVIDRPINIAFLSGTVSAKDAKDIKDSVKNGNIDIIIGTHSVFNIEYKELGLLIVDEQHKFGTDQREKLIKPNKKGMTPDFISQTATPIPRSTALAFYGNTNLIQIKDKPKGRIPIKTEWIKESPKKLITHTKLIEDEMWETIYSEIDAGRQVFFVCSSVDTDDTSSQLSVKDTDKYLRAKFKNRTDISISTIHGKMSKDKQEESIRHFREKKSNILIASSIIEVGVDVPDATVMVILDANRFGAAQLHQIRGRVGRNSIQSYCYLVAEHNEASEIRLNSLVNSNDGFEIALIDLETRNQGDVFGTQQSGDTKLRFVDITNHTSMIENAIEMADRILASNVKEQAISDAETFLRINTPEEQK